MGVSRSLPLNLDLVLGLSGRRKRELCEGGGRDESVSVCVSVNCVGVSVSVRVCVYMYVIVCVCVFSCLSFVRDCSGV